MNIVTFGNLNSREIYPGIDAVYCGTTRVQESVRGQFGYEEVWTCGAMDAEMKAVLSFMVGART